MHAYNLADWAAYFTAITGAAAALAGLVFVAVSINLKNILEEGSMLPTRAGETLTILLFVVVTAALALVPQDLAALGAETLAVVLPLGALSVRNQVRFHRANPDVPLLWSLGWAATSIGLVPGLLGGISLTAHWGGGLYWLLAAGLLGIVSGVFSAWVLLVEIVR